MRHLIAILLQNEAGALTRVTGLISARGYNIESLSVAPTNDPTVFLATGHEGLGITTSLATARLLSDYFAGRKSLIPLEPYLPSRFIPEISHA